MASAGSLNWPGAGPMKSWSKPVRVNDEPGSVWGFAVSKPRIAVSKSGTIHVFFPGNERSPVTKLDVVTARYTRSTDDGRTFEAARTINRPPDFDRTEILGEGLSATFSFGTMGVAPDGVELLVVPGIDPGSIKRNDFSRTTELIDRAHAATGAWLDAHRAVANA